MERGAGIWIFDQGPPSSWLGQCAARVVIVDVAVALSVVVDASSFQRHVARTDICLGSPPRLRSVQTMPRPARTCRYHRGRGWAWRCRSSSTLSRRRRSYRRRSMPAANCSRCDSRCSNCSINNNNCLKKLKKLKKIKLKNNRPSSALIMDSFCFSDEDPDL